MAYEVLMPKLSSTMAEGSITQWFKAEGEHVEVGEAIFEVMTDKIAIEVESYEEGVLLKRYYEVDESAPINSVVAYLGVVGEDVPDTPPLRDEDVKADSLVKTALSKDLSSEKNAKAPTVAVSASQVRGTPAARKLAREHELTLAEIAGSGANGRVHVSDVENYLANQNNKTLEKVSEVKVIPWSGMRKAIAEGMVKSKNDLPHVTMDAQVDLTEVIKLREKVLPKILEKTNLRISYTEILIKATTLALQQFPRLNAQALADGIHEFSQVNIGVAVSVDDGLVVPVIQGAEAMSLTELTKATKQVVEKARTGKLTGTELTGGTFTISSLGQGVVRSFNPIINAPEVAILGVSSLFESVYQTPEGKIELRPTLTLSLSFDHRAIDGAPVAAFLKTLVDLLEEPYTLLI